MDLSDIWTYLPGVAACNLFLCRVVLDQLAYIVGEDVIESLPLSNDEEIGRFWEKVYIPFLTPPCINKLIGSELMTKPVVQDAMKLALKSYLELPRSQIAVDLQFVLTEDFDSLWKSLGICTLRFR